MTRESIGEQMSRGKLCIRPANDSDQRKGQDSNQENAKAKQLHLVLADEETDLSILNGLFTGS